MFIQTGIFIYPYCFIESKRISWLDSIVFRAVHKSRDYIIGDAYCEEGEPLMTDINCGILVSKKKTYLKTIQIT